MELALFFYPLGFPEQLEPVPGPNIVNLCSSVWGTLQIPGKHEGPLRLAAAWRRVRPGWSSCIAVIWAKLLSLSGLSVILRLVERFTV